jgi:mono/diheme cytochrome c family protein
MDARSRRHLLVEGVMLKSSLLVFAALLVAAICLPLIGRNPQAAQAPASNPVKPTPQSQAKAKEIYKRDCALCHGDTGNGKSDLATSLSLTLDDWTDPKTLADKPDSALFAAIRNGKNQMPPEDSGRADDSDVWNLIVYIRSLSKAQPSAAPTPAAASSRN